MTPSSPRQQGHWPTLVTAFLYFDLSFLVWVLLGSLGAVLAAEYRLSPAEKGWLITVPILSGSVLRIVLGVASDRIGARRTALFGLAMTIVPLLLGWLWADSFAELLVVGVLLGVAGGSLGAAFPLASRWYPKDQQGAVLGIVGMGNGGTALATVLAPWLAFQVGWRGVFGLALIPIAIVLAMVGLVARDAEVPRPSRRLRDQLAVLGLRDTYWYCGLYALTFGGFLGLASFLPLLFKEQYGVDPIRAGMFATICATLGSLLRPVGGAISDRVGGVLILFIVFLSVGFLGLRMSYVPHLEVAMLCVFLTFGLLGLGSGAIFQLVPQRFSEDLGAVTGLVGAAGGLGGAFLPLAMAGSWHWTGRFGPVFFVIGIGGFLAAGLLIQASREWQAGGWIANAPAKSARPLPVHERGATLVDAGVETLRRLG